MFDTDKVDSHLDSLDNLKLPSFPTGALKDTAVAMKKDVQIIVHILGDTKIKNIQQAR